MLLFKIFILLNHYFFIFITFTVLNCIQNRCAQSFGSGGAHKKLGTTIILRAIIGTKNIYSGTSIIRGNDGEGVTWINEKHS